MRRKIYFFSGAEIMGFIFINYYKNGLLSKRVADRISRMKDMFEAVKKKEIDRVSFFDLSEEVWFDLVEEDGEFQFKRRK